MGSIQTDWTKFTLRIFINKPVQDIYNSWTIPSNLSTWFLEKADYISADGKDKNPNENVVKGDKYKWKWNNWDVVEEGEVLEANGKDQFSFTFGKAGNVHVLLSKTEKGTEVKLIQDNIPTDDESRMNYYVGCNQGWTFWITNLKAWLEHGVLLNAKGFANDELKWLVNS